MMLVLDVRNESSRKHLYRSDNLWRLAEKIIASERQPKGRRAKAAALELSVLFCDDPDIAGLNARYRNKQGPTDVLAFGEDAPIHGGAEVLGDIVISLETVERFCQGDRKAMREEVRLLFCHGLLHLLGYDHATESERAEMNELQARYLGVSEQAAWRKYPAGARPRAGKRAREGAE